MFKQILPTELQIAPAEDGREGPACQLGRWEMIFDEQIISLVSVTSTAKRNNDSSVDKALNNKTGQRSQLSIFWQAVPLDVAEAAIHNNLFSQD